MSDSIFVRVQRVVSGGVESAVDLAEQLSGTSLARQALREMDAAIAKAGDDADEALMRRLQAGHQLDTRRKELAKLKEQARFAMGQGRDDLAEAAIARQIEVEQQIDRLAKADADARGDEARIADSIAGLRVRKNQMEEQFAAFQSAQRAAEAEAEAAQGNAVRAERKARRAEEALDRAIAAAGGIAGDRTSPEGAAKVAEIARLQKEAAVAERLAALRAAAAGIADAVKKPRAKRRD
jgi:phage shock protein A